MAGVLEADDDEVLTLAEAAAILKISVTSAKIYASDGRIPAFKIGKLWRVRRQALRELMQGTA